ncbi:MAG: DUF924 family protein [Gammaproteobacteria bacterium]
MEDVLSFWFETLDPTDWFHKSDEVDATIRQRFTQTYERISVGEGSSWRVSPLGRLAEILVLDQLPRNMFRGTAKAFATDAMALVLSQEGIRQGADLKLDAIQRGFFYMPFMHSESLAVHSQAMVLFKDLKNFDYEVKHRDIIERFGRYPHRNGVLGRQSTPSEVEWMQSNSGF